MKNQQNRSYIDQGTQEGTAVKVRKLYFMGFFPSVFRLVNKISLIIALVRAQFIVKTAQGTLLSNKMDK